MGVSVYKHKVMAFVISAGMAGLAGALFAYSEQYVAPNNFGFDLSISLLLAVTLGGRKSRVGPILGSVVIVLLPNLLADIELFRIIAGHHRRGRARRRWGRACARPRNKTFGPDPDRAVPGVFRLCHAAHQRHRLAAVDLRGDDPVRRLLLAGRHFGYLRRLFRLRDHAVIEAAGEGDKVWAASPAPKMRLRRARTCSRSSRS